ncbi:MAG: cytochrome c [Calditrichaceae bacterium]|nr:cytochrome c [Calditrichaceae bacterium]MBN2708325.1 cytochrome c [Calditrichaceae bacterium]RQV95214.1 MAG: cytochrome c [Calditrichota bacterium]
MDKKAVIFFAVLISLALALIVLFKVQTDPLENFVSSESAGFQHYPELEKAIILYQKNCNTCHGSFGEGMSGNPRLREIKLTVDQIKTIIRNGQDEMPAFPDIQEPELSRLAELIKYF